MTTAIPPSSGAFAPDTATLNLRAGNTNTVIVTASTVQIDGTLSGTGIDELLGGLGGDSSAGGDPGGDADLSVLSAFAPGSFTVSDGRFRFQGKSLQLLTTQRVTLEGTARLILI